MSDLRLNGLLALGVLAPFAAGLLLGEAQLSFAQIAHAFADPASGLAQALSAARADVQAIRYRGLGHEMLVGALARPLRWRAPVLQDLCAFLGKPRGAAAWQAQS